MTSSLKGPRLWRQLGLVSRNQMIHCMHACRSLSRITQQLVQGTQHLEFSQQSTTSKNHTVWANLQPEVWQTSPALDKSGPSNKGVCPQERREGGRRVPDHSRALQLSSYCQPQWRYCRQLQKNLHNSLHSVGSGNKPVVSILNSDVLAGSK